MRVYLDYLSTCPLLAEVREAMSPFLTEEFGNPSSVHRAGLAARQAIASARERIAELVNAESPESILFTGSGAEAINLAVKGAALASQRFGKHIVYSAIEQPAVTRSIDFLAELGFSSTKIPVDAMGRIDLEAFESALRKDTILACVHHGNPDIGTIQEVARIGEITSQHGVTLLVDATASAGWAPLGVQGLKADLVALAPHRFYGPKGVGVLYRQRRARVTPLIHGGEQEGGKRAGTENVAAIVGAGKAAELARHDLPKRQSHTRALQNRALAEILRLVPHVKLNGPPPGPERLPHHLSLSVEFVEGEGLALMLDIKGVALSTGAACVTRSMRVPPVLAAIGLPESLAKGSVILSFGQETSEVEVDFAAAALAQAAIALREMSPLWEDFKKGQIRSELEDLKC